MDIDKLKKVLDQNFGEPFLPKGKVETSIRTVGRRDIELDNNLNVVSSGTCLIEDYITVEE